MGVAKLERFGCENLDITPSLIQQFLAAQAGHPKEINQ
jgi:hypothetical protein